MTTQFGREPVGLVQCDSCRVTYLREWPAFVDVAIYDYYDERIGWQREQLYDSITSTRLSSVLSDLDRLAPRRTLLDVGCGAGQLVAAAADLGWVPRGIDVADGAIRICKRFNLPCSTTDFFDPSLDHDRFGAITMVELLEHVTRPGRFLQRAEGLLEPGGLIYITTPNFASLTRRVVGAQWRAISPDHLSYFTSGTLRGLVKRETALEIVSIETRNVSPTAIAAAARNALRRRRRHEAAVLPHHGVDGVVMREQSLRQTIETSRGLRVAKKTLNHGLRLLHLGDTLELVLRRPLGES